MVSYQYADKSDSHTEIIKVLTWDRQCCYVYVLMLNDHCYDVNAQSSDQAEASTATCSSFQWLSVVSSVNHSSSATQCLYCSNLAFLNMHKKFISNQKIMLMITGYPAILSLNSHDSTCPRPTPVITLVMRGRMKRALHTDLRQLINKLLCLVIRVEITGATSLSLLAGCLTLVSSCLQIPG